MAGRGGKALVFTLTAAALLAGGGSLLAQTRVAQPLTGAQPVGSAAAQTAAAAPDAAPRSAIPWLSESVRSRPAPLPVDPDAEPGTADPGIETSRLDGFSRDSVGLLEPRASGFPQDLWRGLTTEEVQARLARSRSAGVPATRALYRKLLLAQSTAPEGGESGAPTEGQLFLARVDKLMEMGALDEADLLITMAGISDQDTFRRHFDISLLTNRASDACGELESSPDLGPTLPVRVFCLARGGDWNAAALSLSLGTELGLISLEQSDLLTYFLDPELFDDEFEPDIPEPLTVLDFILREAVALPRPDDTLPLAFLHADLSPHMPMRARIAAAERLVRSGAITEPLLFAAYRSGRPAASGGVWDRAEAVQDLDHEFSAGEPKRIIDAVKTADGLMRQRGLRLQFAREFNDLLADLRVVESDRDTARCMAEILILGGRPDAAADWLEGHEVPPRLALALSLAGRGTPLEDMAEPDAALDRAVYRAFSGAPDDDPATAELLARLDQGSTGAVMLDTLALLQAGPDVDPGDLERALRVLLTADQERDARRIAIQTLLLSQGMQG
ncbi:hypothetical protein [Oceanomicrobium pacificus]|uniref:Uncharacterized protein n=1 Tax=Oceanomicrobium pacificus TaxID=2692916 RepID=A0A6B0TZ04_9RHOB|nr:hypothetical protein [Oceanomicrobium pacificus]MXU66254.1 hypothetical protein [Oceanomicrobium pacificus]